MLPIILAAFLISPAQATARAAVEIEVFDGDKLLISDPGMWWGSGDGVVYLIHMDGSLVHTWRTKTDWTHAAEYLQDGQVIIASTGDNRLLRVAANGEIIWSSDSIALSDGSTFNYPNDIQIVDQNKYLVSDSHNHRVIEVDEEGQVHWQFGVTGIPGKDALHLDGPHNPERLANGNTLIADSGNNRILEIDRNGIMVWYYWPTGTEALNWPRDADELPNGNLLIADTFNNELRIVDRAGVLLTRIPLPSTPYEADAMGDGSFVVSCVSPGQSGGIYRVDIDGNVLWQYPDYGNPTNVTAQVNNDMNGVSIFVESHLPDQIRYPGRRPAVLYVPGGLEDGSFASNAASSFARLGIVGVHFDPDGRGLSTNGGTYLQDDFGGAIHQNGFRKVLEYIRSLSRVDPDRIVVISQDYGNTIALGAVAGLPPNESPLAIIDIEGPASRSQAASANGGLIPIDPADNLSWSNREAVTLITGITCGYVRLQSLHDEFGLGPINRHAIALLNNATNVAFGGNGQASFSRANHFLDNPANFVWVNPQRPRWISEELDTVRFRAFDLNTLVNEIIGMPAFTVAGSLNPGGNVLLELNALPENAGDNFGMAISNSLFPLALVGGGWLNLGVSPMLEPTYRIGKLDLNGNTSIGYSIPNNPTLSGRTYFAQASIFLSAMPIPHLLSKPVAFTIQ